MDSIIEAYTYSSTGRKIKFTNFYHEESYGTLNYKEKKYCAICLRGFSSKHLKHHKKQIVKLVQLFEQLRIDYGAALYILSFIDFIPLNPLPPQGVLTTTVLQTPPIVIDLISDDERRITTVGRRKRRFLSEISAAYVMFQEAEAGVAPTTDGIDESYHGTWCTTRWFGWGHGT